MWSFSVYFVLVKKELNIFSSARRDFNDPSLNYCLKSEEYNDEYGRSCAVSLLGWACHLARCPHMSYIVQKRKLRDHHRNAKLERLPSAPSAGGEFGLSICI